jgi:hypothetical protein
MQVWMEAVPLRNMEDSTCTYAFIVNWVARFDTHVYGVHLAAALPRSRPLLRSSLRLHEAPMTKRKCFAAVFSDYTTLTPS